MEDIFQAMYTSDQWYEIILNQWDIKRKIIEHAREDDNKEEEQDQREDGECASGSFDNAEPYDAASYTILLLY